MVSCNLQMSQRLTVRDVSAAAFIKAYAEHLKKGGKFELPKWSEYIKTGVARELGPVQDDWYFHRAGMSSNSSMPSVVS